MHGQFTSTRSIRGTVILIMALAILAASPLPLAAQNTGVTGAVKNASGEPVAGALVKIRNEERGLAFTVVSQAQGRYSTPNLLPGKYAVQGFGGDVQTEPRQIEVKSEQQGKLDVVLSIPLKIAPPQKR